MRNYYDLINSLLEDGSEQSLMKLKMIVDFEDFFENYLDIYEKLSNENLLKFLNLFYNFFEQRYSETDLDIILINQEIRLAVIKMFKHVFYKHVVSNPSMILYIHYEQIEFIKLYEDVYNLDLFKEEKNFKFIYPSNHEDFFKMFPELKKT